MHRKLSDLKIRKIKLQQDGRTKKYTDGGRLYLLVNSKGKYWRYGYNFQKKQKSISFGVYPEISLMDARIAHQEARELLSRGIDPLAHRKMKQITGGVMDNNTFQAVGLEWFAMWKDDNSENHMQRTLVRLEKDIFPWIGSRPMIDIEPPEILMLLRRVESRGAFETAHRVKQLIGQVFRYAVATGRAQRDQTADLKGALKPYRKKHFPAITDPIEFGHLLRVIEEYRGSLVVRCAFKLSPLVMLRPNELAGAKWSEIDFNTATWTIPVKRMKAKKYIKEENATSHIVPLSKQAIVILREIELLTGRFEHVFTGARNRRKPMSSASVNMALKRLGYGETMKAHSFRTTASTLLNQMNYNPDAIERQLAHKDKDRVRAVYNRAEYVEERRDMLQHWADYLDSLREGADIIPFKKKA
ncbi:MAG: tyrosine-type recombinase/integrase [Cocleimonas sp.]|nr:tyrosine-type recombinase/integrase [Cocleimonas sp.]